MRCPRCGSDNERDVSKAPCSRCGLLVRMPERPRSSGRPVTRGSGEPLVPGYTTNPFLTRLQTNSPNQSETGRNAKEQKEEFVFQLSKEAPLQEGVMLVNTSPLLTPGTLLRGGRYRLQDYRGYQEWLDGVYEATWIAQDAQRAGMKVVISELVIPDTASVPVHAMLRLATMALTSIGRHPDVPTLWDAFSDQGENFFVFEPVEGETLLERMQRTGRAFPEQAITEMGLQVLDILGSAWQQMPPLIHGLIQPEHIAMTQLRSTYKLTNFSIVLAGRAMQLVAGIDSFHSSPYFSPEFMQGKIDASSDLYALVATMYHTVTGSLPSAIDGSIPEARRLNPTISTAMNDLLAKGLHSLPEHRFQHSAELRQALVALQRNDVSSGVTGTEQRPVQQSTPVQTSLSLQQPSPLPATTLNVVNVEDAKPGTRVSALDEIALMDGRNTNLVALALIIGIVVCLLVVLALWRFLLY